MSTDANERAYDCLQWQALAQLAPYDESIDYVTIQKKRSDAAVSAFEKEHPQKGRNDEMTAYLKLVSLKVIPESEYYSPTEAYPPAKHQDYDPERWKGAVYTRRLAEYEASTASRSADKAGTSRGTCNSERKGEGLPFLDEEQGFRIRRTRGRKRC